MPIQSVGKLKQMLEKVPPNLPLEVSFAGKVLMLEKFQFFSNPQKNPRVVLLALDYESEIDQLDAAMNASELENEDED
jgi:hypothetical protein